MLNTINLIIYRCHGLAQHHQDTTSLIFLFSSR